MLRITVSAQNRWVGATVLGPFPFLVLQHHAALTAGYCLEHSDMIPFLRPRRTAVLHFALVFSCFISSDVRISCFCTVCLRRIFDAIFATDSFSRSRARSIESFHSRAYPFRAVHFYSCSLRLFPPAVFKVRDVGPCAVPPKRLPPRGTNKRGYAVWN